MIYSSGFIMFILMGIAICIGKLMAGDKSMGCLIPLLIVVLLMGFMGFILSAITML